MSEGADGKTPRLSDTQRLAWLQLIRSENVGPITFRMLINRFGGADRALEALPALSARGGLKRAIKICPQESAASELAEAQRRGLEIVALGEPHYPAGLRAMESAPPLLFVNGNLDALTRPMIAMVGSRNCSAAGARLAAGIASGLAGAGHVIVSGLARGIDAAAHKATLASGTVAVLAGGVDNIYPSEHADLYAAIRERGAIVSEMPLGFEPRARDFPRRNRIIAGLSMGTVVVEAAKRSGSLITARLAGEMGREVFAVPGSPLDPRADGPNGLIKDGAVLTRNATDVLEALPRWGNDGLAPPPAAGLPDGVAAAGGEWSDDVADGERARVASALGAAPIEIDEIIRHTGLAPAVVLTALLELELAGRLARHPGQRVSLV